MKRIQNKRYSGLSYHWCPNGCGKCVQFTGWNTLKKKWVKKDYRCIRCGKIFKKEEIEK